MTEPSEIADSVEIVAEGVWHWRIRNAGIGGEISSSHAVAADGGCVLIDPVRLSAEALAALPTPSAILLNAKTHQRSSWRYRRELGIEVWLPADAPAADEEPDRRYAENDILPGELRAIRTPGPEWPHYSFLLERDPGVLFCSDLLSNAGGRELRSCPPRTTRTLPRPAGASSGCSTWTSRFSAWTTAHRSCTTRRPRSGDCSPTSRSAGAGGSCFRSVRARAGDRARRSTRRAAAEARGSPRRRLRPRRRPPRGLRSPTPGGQRRDQPAPAPWLLRP